VAEVMVQLIPAEPAMITPVTVRSPRTRDIYHRDRGNQLP
jgi:hypothetical protein